MSSFVGHALTAGAIYVASPKANRSFTFRNAGWLGCLLLASIAPDLDYLLPFLQKSQHGGIRITNSFAFSLVIPALVCLGLWLARIRGRELWLRSLQITLAGLSHIVLDYLVGVHPSPLFWPLSREEFVSPIGILPSAGALRFSNLYLYRNLLIEVGVLLPLYFVFIIGIRRRAEQKRLRFPLLAGLLLVSAGCAFWAASLTR